MPHLLSPHDLVQRSPTLSGLLLTNELYSVQLLYEREIHVWGVMGHTIPSGVQGLFLTLLRAHSWWCLGDHVSCQGLNPGQASVLCSKLSQGKGFPGANILRKRGSRIEMRAMVGNLGHFSSDGRTITLFLCSTTAHQLT